MSDTTEKECNICNEVLGPNAPNLEPLLVNGVWTCRGCLNDVFRRVINHDDKYPVLMNGELIDLGEFSAYVDHDLLETYHQLAPELSIHPYRRVYCACGTFIAETVTPNPTNPLEAVDECPACKKTACKACKKPINNKDPKACASNHSCKEKIEAAEKEHQKLLDGEDCGTKYQVCPICRRNIQLHSACYHIYCQCRGHFCYKCGVRTFDDSHWGGGIFQCELYPNKLSPAQEALELLPPEDQERVIREALLDVVLGLRDYVQEDPVVQKNNAVWALKRLLKMEQELANGGTLLIEQVLRALAVAKRHSNSSDIQQASRKVPSSSIRAEVHGIYDQDGGSAHKDTLLLNLDTSRQTSSSSKSSSKTPVNHDGPAGWPASGVKKRAK